MTETHNPAEPVPFRAGRRVGEAPMELAMETRDALTWAGSRVLMADISEFQPNIADDIYVKNFSQAVIIRAAYGTSHVDRAWYGGDRRAQLHQHGIRFLGIYQYIRASQDARAQADMLGNLLGSLRPGEKVIADFEEGTGNQHSRWDAWANRIAQLGEPPWIYSGLWFAANHGLQPVDWVAAYQRTEPSVPHTLWQFTDAYSIPGIAGGVDCSVYHGTIDQLAALAYGGQHPQQDWTEEAIMALPTLQEGARDGGGMLLVHRIQNDVAGIGRWNQLGTVTALKDDGVWGPATTAGVKAIQRFFHLADDGVVGPDTWKKLIGV